MNFWFVLKVSASVSVPSNILHEQGLSWIKLPSFPDSSFYFHTSIEQDYKLPFRGSMKIIIPRPDGSKDHLFDLKPIGKKAHGPGIQKRVFNFLKFTFSVRIRINARDFKCIFHVMI